LEAPSDLNLKYAYILRAADAVGAVLPLEAEGRKTLELCLDEALANAMVWGNLGDPGKKVRVCVWEEQGRWGFTVSDEGKGFKPSALPDYESEDFPWRERGRGIFVLLNHLSEVSFHDGGRTIVAKS
ncbi:MAG: ATP-binding protein, partial [Thermoanaerobaculia bacterium]